MRRSSPLKASIVRLSRRSRKQALHVQEVVAVRGARPLGREADDEPLDVAPELQEQPLAREVDRRDLEPVPGADDDKGVVGRAG